MATTNDPKGERSRKNDRTGEAFRTIIILITVGIAGVIGYAVCAASAHAWLCYLSIGLLIATASLAVGGFFGFLFGMPRAAAPAAAPGAGQGATDVPEKPEPGPGQPRTKPNTNLEEISDWLTKILVGAGLTQLNKIQVKLAELSTYLARGMGDTNSDRTFVSVELVFFGVCGFLVAFLWTRLYLGKAIQQADDVEAVKEALEQTGRTLEETDKRQQAQIEEARSVVKEIAQTAAAQAMEDPLLSERGPFATGATQVQLAAKLVREQPETALAASDLLILAYDNLQHNDFKSAIEKTEKALSTQPPKELLWNIHNLLGLCNHWLEPPNWKPGDDATWFDKAVQHYELAVSNRNTLSQELLSKANAAFVYLDAQRYTDCENKAAEVTSNQALGGLQIAQICDLARIAAACAKVLRGDTVDAQRVLNETANIASFEYLFNTNDLPKEAITKLATLPGLKTEAASFLTRVATALQLIPQAPQGEARGH